MSILIPQLVLPQSQISEDTEQQTLTIDDAPEMKVIAISKNVVVRKHVKDVLAWGGTVTIEGIVDGDVAAIGGSVIQKEGSFIGGDVIVFGGQYRSEGSSSKRVEGKNTIMFGVFEEELRGLARDPTELLSPKLSVTFVIHRVLAILFWFIVTMIAATITPGAVSRGVVGLRLSTLKITGIGAAAFLLTCIAAVIGVGFLPEYLSVVVGLMAFALIMLAYGFGRVVMNAFVGKLILDRFFASHKISESITILAGVMVNVLLLSIPYVWPLALFAFFAIGTGLVVTSRSYSPWKAR
ncbi:MAG: hypothetical protein ACJ72Z_04080 [Pyrinomonadaceae bacterium]